MRPGWVLVVALFGTAMGAMEEACCPGSPNETVVEGKCPDRSELRLDCGGYPKYSLNPSRENYTLQNGQLIIRGPHGEDRITMDRFCTIPKLINEKWMRVPLLCFEEYPEEMISTKVYSYCLLVSVAFLLITLVTYWVLPVLRDLQGHCVMCFVASLAAGYFCLSMMQLELVGDGHITLCIVAGFLNYYLFLCIFFWLFIICFNIWRTARHIVTKDERTLWIGYLVSGFGGPFVLLCIAFIAHHVPGNHLKPGFGQHTCWFSGKGETWVFFYGPMSLLLIGNITFFFMTVVRLWQDYRNSTPVSRIRVLRFKCILYLKLFLTMGISWIFEIISFLVGGIGWYITDILNCLQGVIIFIVMVATRKRVLRALAMNKTFGSCFNKSWQTIPDEESEELTNREQIQLGNQ